MKYIIIGLGNFGTSLGLRLCDLGHEVIGIDTRESIVEEFKDKLTGTVCMNSVDEASLRSQSVMEVDAVIVAIGEDWAASIQTTALLQQMHVKRIIGRSLSKLHETVLTGLGIKEIINPEYTAALEIANSIVSRSVVHTYNITSRIAINEITVPNYFANQTVQDIDLAKNFGLTLIAIKYQQATGGKMYSGNKGSWQVTRYFEDFKFSEGDRIVVYGDNDQMQKLLDLINK